MKKSLSLILLLVCSLSFAANNGLLLTKRNTDDTQTVLVQLLEPDTAGKIGMVSLSGVDGGVSYTYFGDGLSRDGNNKLNVAVNGAMVVSGLGFTPYDSANPAGFISGITGSQVTAALGFTPVSQSGARSSITLTSTGSGAASYNSGTGVLNIPTPSTATIINRAVVSTATDGTYIWTMPTACTGTPAVAVTPQNNTSAEVINHKITAVSSTSVSISLSRAVLTLNGVLGLTIPVIQASPGAQTVHLIAVCP